MIVIWIVVYWGIGLVTAIFGAAALAGILSFFIVLARCSDHPEHRKYLIGHIFTGGVFGLLSWLGVFLWQWLTGHFPSPGSVGFWIGIGLGSLGALKMIPFLTNFALQQTLPK